MIDYRAKKKVKLEFSGRTGNIKEQTGVENAEFYKHTVIDLLDEVGKK